jgi:hypothetical protein
METMSPHTLKLAAVLAVAVALGAPSVANAAFTLPGQNTWDVRTDVVSKNAGHQLAYGLSSPRSITVCADCQGGESAGLGSYAGGTQLTAFLTDSNCTATFDSNGNHARVTQLGQLKWGIDWDDTGGTCGFPDEDFNDLIATITATYRFGGLRDPVDPGVVNVAKAGSAIPVKFSLSGNAGLGIFEDDYPSSRTIACTSGLPTDLIEETTVANGSGLKYEAASDQYNYVWKTNKAWAGTCRELNLKLTDGTSHTARFAFK